MPMALAMSGRSMAAAVAVEEIKRFIMREGMEYVAETRSDACSYRDLDFHPRKNQPFLFCDQSRVAGSTRIIRSSELSGLPRPSVLLVVMSSVPSRFTVTALIRPYVPLRCVLSAGVPFKDRK